MQHDHHGVRTGTAGDYDICRALKSSGFLRPSLLDGESSIGELAVGGRCRRDAIKGLRLIVGIDRRVG